MSAYCLTWTEYRLSALCKPAGTLAAEPKTVFSCSPLHNCRNACSLPTCDEEAIAERCACLRLDAYPAAEPLPSFLRRPFPLDRGETRLTGAATVARKDR